MAHRLSRPTIGCQLSYLRASPFYQSFTRVLTSNDRAQFYAWVEKVAVAKIPEEEVDLRGQGRAIRCRGDETAAAGASATSRIRRY
jgi:hypothetical protein